MTITSASRSAPLKIESLGLLSRPDSKVDPFDAKMLHSVSIGVQSYDRQVEEKDIVQRPLRRRLKPLRASTRRYEPFPFARGKELTNQQGNPHANPNHPFFNRTICFTGRLGSMRRREAAYEVCSAGGHFRNSASTNLDYLVLGNEDLVSFAEGRMTTKLETVERFRGAGSKTKIISERTFLMLLAAEPKFTKRRNGTARFK